MQTCLYPKVQASPDPRLKDEDLGVRVNPKIVIKPTDSLKPLASYQWDKIEMEGTDPARPGRKEGGDCGGWKGRGREGRRGKGEKREGREGEENIHGIHS